MLLPCCLLLTTQCAANKINRDSVPAQLFQCPGVAQRMKILLAGYVLECKQAAMSVYGRRPSMRHMAGLVLSKIVAKRESSEISSLQRAVCKKEKKINPPFLFMKIEFFSVERHMRSSLFYVFFRVIFHASILTCISNIPSQIISTSFPLLTHTLRCLPTALSPQTLSHGKLLLQGMNG